uniref:Palmitoyltransferase n=1 Tax=Rhipicephalus zambeziensis TaxID=60191 RepID=A0A224Z464_9ACAR
MIADCKTYQERKEILEALGSSRGILTRAADGSVRYCEQCGLIKPDRCHHCSCCRRCILKMDHHCPWLNNCVAFSTYKFFLLTLFYVVLLASYTFVTVSSYALDTATAMGLPTGVLVHTGFLLLAGTALTVLIGGFFGVHVCILCRNETTLETMRPFVFVESLDSFNLGVRRNIIEVFGSNVYLWPFPVHSTPGDGVCFPTKLHPDRQTPILPLLRQRSRQVALSLSGRDLPVVSPSMETAFGDLVPSPAAAAARHVSTTTSHGEPGRATTRPEGEAYDTAVETSGLSLSSTSEQYRSGLSVSAMDGGGTAPVTRPPGLISPVAVRLPLQRLAATPGQGSSVVIPRPTLFRTDSSFVSVQTR